MTTLNRSGSLLGASRSRVASKPEATPMVTQYKPPGAIPRTKGLTAAQAFTAMEGGAVLHRIGPDGASAKYYRINAGQVESADTVQALSANKWHASKIDVDIWYRSTFHKVKVTVQVVEVNYE